MADVVTFASNGWTLCTKLSEFCQSGRVDGPRPTLRRHGVSVIRPSCEVCVPHNPSLPMVFSLNRSSAWIYRRNHLNALMFLWLMMDRSDANNGAPLSLATGLLKSGACSILFDCLFPLCSRVGGS